MPRAKKITWLMRTRNTNAVTMSSWNLDVKASKDKAFDSMVAQSKSMPRPIAKGKQTKMSGRSLVEFH